MYVLSSLLFLSSFFTARSQTLPGSQVLRQYDATLEGKVRTSELLGGDEVWLSLVTVSGWGEVNGTNGTMDWQYKYQTAFDTLVDDFVLLQLYDSHSLSLSTDPFITSGDTHFRVEMGNLVSPWKKREQDEYTVPFFTLLIEIEDGDVKALKWDDYCPDKCNGICVDGNCGEPKCKPTSNDGADCDLKTYVGWTGTDKNGVYMTSAGRRISVFRQFSVGTTFDQAVKGVSDTVSNIPPPSEMYDDVKGEITG